MAEVKIRVLTVWLDGERWKEEGLPAEAVATLIAIATHRGHLVLQRALAIKEKNAFYNNENKK